MTLKVATIAGKYGLEIIRMNIVLTIPNAVCTDNNDLINISLALLNTCALRHLKVRLPNSQKSTFVRLI